MNQYGIYTVLVNMAAQNTPKLAGIDQARLVALLIKTNGIDFFFFALPFLFYFLLCAQARDSVVAVSPLLPVLPSAGSQPLAINASFFVGHPVPPTPNGFLGWPDSVDYMVNVPAATRVRITVTAGSDDPGVLPLNVTLGGAAPTLVPTTCPSSGDWAKYVNCTSTPAFDVSPGVSVFRIGRGRLWLGAILFTPE